MSSDLAIEARQVGKQFRLRPPAPAATTLAEWMVQRLRNPFAPRQAMATFQALQDVSFTVERGTVLGIIGPNGAGKSTLLKVLSRITPPTSGEIDLQGRVASLLEVGTGFHPELTGRENIYLNGALLGMSRREIRKHFDAIVDFSGTEAFLDTPVKRYSSGMYVRLAFSVAAHLESEILIVDEVLAVGDAAFQRKCLGKMGEITVKEGRTILFVSHSMAAIQQLCSDCLLLEGGRLIARGLPSEITARYLHLEAAKAGEPLGTEAESCRVVLEFGDGSTDSDQAWRYGESLRVRVTVAAREELLQPAVDLAFYDAERRRLFALRSDHARSSPTRIGASAWLVEWTIDNPGWTIPEMTIDVGVRQGMGEYVALFCHAARIAVDLTGFEDHIPVNCLLQPKAVGEWRQVP